jgi:hypothetical protein
MKKDWEIRNSTYFKMMFLKILGIVCRRRRQAVKKKKRKKCYVLYFENKISLKSKKFTFKNIFLFKISKTFIKKKLGL